MPSLYIEGAFQDFVQELQRYEVDTAAIQEIQWLGHGILQRNDSSVYYNCHKNKHQFGIEFIVNWKNKRTMEFRPVDERNIS
jgi:hypothetical protein